MHTHISTGHTLLFHFISSVYFTEQSLFVCQLFIYGNQAQNLIGMFIVHRHSDATGMPCNHELHFCSSLRGI